MADVSSAFRDGWCAHALALCSSSNPYSQVTQSGSHLDWRAGWHDRAGVCFFANAEYTKFMAEGPYAVAWANSAMEKLKFLDRKYGVHND